MVRCGRPGRRGKKRGREHIPILLLTPAQPNTEHQGPRGEMHPAQGKEKQDEFHVTQITPGLSGPILVTQKNFHPMPASLKIQLLCASHHKKKKTNKQKNNNKKKNHESYQQILKLLGESLVGNKILTRLRLVINYKGENCNLTVTESTK